MEDMEADDATGDAEAGSGGGIWPPKDVADWTEREWLLYVASPSILLGVLAVGLGVYCWLRSRWRRRQQIQLLWQQHIQDSSGAYDAFLDTPPPQQQQIHPALTPQQRFTSPT